MAEMPAFLGLVPGFLDLYEDAMMYRALDAAGVDNWEGWDEVNGANIELLVERQRNRATVAGDSPHVKHAARELELLGQTAEDPGYAHSIILAVAALHSYGHSGGSMLTAIAALKALLDGRALVPLTDDPAEWIDRSEVSGYSLWQNNRDTTAFSQDAGKTHWTLELGRDHIIISAPAVDPSKK